MQKLDLSGLLGTFRGTDRISASAWSEREDAVATAVGVVRLAGGLVVQSHETSRVVGDFSALNVFLPDPETGEVLLYSFDSLGHPPDPPARGTWEDGALVLRRATARGESCTTYRPTDDGFVWQKEFRASPAEPWQSVVSGELVRCDGDQT